MVEVAVGVLVDERAGEPAILIARRRPQTVLGGYWEFPGGKREAGESLAGCVQREFAEEVGLQVAVTEALPRVSHVYEHAHVQLHPFFCRWVGGEVRLLAVSEARWVVPGELADYRFPPANEDLVRAVVGRLAAGEIGGVVGG